MKRRRKTQKSYLYRTGKSKRVSIGRNGIPPYYHCVELSPEFIDPKGTKEVAQKETVGACTVVIAEITETNKLKYTAIDSCLVFMPMLHGKQLLTVENLKADEKLHPVQQEMVDKNGRSMRLLLRFCDVTVCAL
ncbi:MAG: hypothetical protein IPG90_22090 [Bacteroidetes bacterium]|nr:hypothetical protein [Bacteroidota bacterium]